MDDASVSKYLNQFSLSIRFSSDGFSLLVFDGSGAQISSKNKDCAMFSLSEDEIKHQIYQEPEFKVNYQHIEIICELEKYAVVPTNLFKPANAHDFLSLQHSLIKSDKILYNELELWGLVIVFSIPSTLQNAINHLFPSIKIQHQISNFLNTKISSRIDTAVNVWLRSTVIDVVVVKNNKLLLVNSYAYATPEDFAFYILSVYEQLLLSKDKVVLNMYNAKSKPEIGLLIRQYLSMVIDK